MESKIGIKVFKLTKVNINIRNLYADMTNFTADLTMIGDEAAAISDNMLIENAGKPDEDLTAVQHAEIRAETRKRFQALDERRRTLAVEIVAAREKLLMAILKKNGYDYDAEFWNEEADVEDINDIVTGIFRPAAASKK